MTVQIGWYDHNRVSNVIHWQFQGNWTWPEFFACLEREMALIEPLKGERWDVIVEFIGTPTLPSGSGTVSRVVEALQQGKRANMGLAFVVTQNGFIRAMMNVATRLHPTLRTEFLACETAEQAEACVLHSRATTSRELATTAVRSELTTVP